MCAQSLKVPFAYHDKEEFSKNLSKWIGRVFYDVLPEHGYEIREEQIYTAFQIAHSVCKEKIHLAEAGLGTGKTFAYLVSAVSYARFKGKPAIIACASTALQEQLTAPQGDIEKLSNLLNLDIKARLAKEPRQYICDVKVNRLKNLLYEEPDSVLTKLLDWAGETSRGERSEIPTVPDSLWVQVAWDETMKCETCSKRGFCKLVKAREYYRSASDLIICDHGFFFEDLWMRDERIAEGKLTLLPDYSLVIFDEGHKVPLPATLKAGAPVIKKEIDNMLVSIERIKGARTSLISAIFAVDAACTQFFNILQKSVIKENHQTERLTVRITDELIKAANAFRRALNSLHFELQNEEDLHSQSLSHTRLQAYEDRVERAIRVLEGFCFKKGQEVITWIDREDRSFWVVPRNLSGMLNKNLFERGGLPVVFSSATLSTGGDFSYFARTIGLKDYSSSSVDSSFEYKKQVIIYFPRQPLGRDREDWFNYALKKLVLLLRLARGRALVLTNTQSEVRKIRAALKKMQLPYKFLWEDSAERGYLVRRFREDVSSVLVGSGFWEGIDVPGEALSMLIIWQLPFPLQDPLIEERRRQAQEQGFDPVATVDFPEMGLKLKQGCGRLIRKKDDRGVIAILEPVLGMRWEKTALEALPPGAKVIRDLEAINFRF